MRSGQANKRISDKQTGRRGLLAGRPGLGAFCFFAGGIALGDFSSRIPHFQLSGLVLLIIAAAVTAAGLVYHLRDKSNFATWLLYCALTICGLVSQRIAVSELPPTHVQKLAIRGTRVGVVGRIVEEPDIRQDKTYLTVDVDTIGWRRHRLRSCGAILVKVAEPTSIFSRGDRVAFSGYLFLPGGPRYPGGFDFGRYLKNREIFGMMSLRSADQVRILTERYEPFRLRSAVDFLVNELVVPVREFLVEGYYFYLPPQQASLLAGFVLGEKRGISPEVARLFSDTGTLHLMAVSGSNVGVVAAFLLLLFRPLTRQAKVILTIGGIIFFCFLTRNEPSVVRASLMATIGLGGFYFRRDPDLMALLGFAGLVILLAKPLWLFNVGFQLSMAASAGIVYFVPPIVSKIPVPRTLTMKMLKTGLVIFITTAAAQLAVLPITAHYFGRLPVVGLLANLPMVTLAGILTILGLLFLPFIAVGGPITIAYAAVLNAILSAVPGILSFFAGLPCAVINVGSWPFWNSVVFYAALYLVGELTFRRRFGSVAAFLILAGLGVIAWKSYLVGPREDSLTFVDCGQDRALLFRTHNGRNYLWYDCHEGDTCRQAEMALLPFLRKAGVGQLDSVFSADERNLRALANEVRVGDFVSPSEVTTTVSTLPRDSLESLETGMPVNDQINVVLAVTDNISEPSTGPYFRLTLGDGPVCILAGGLPPAVVAEAINEAFLVELPWSVQPYGVVLDKLKTAAPKMIVYSPDRPQARTLRRRKELTYMNQFVWATSIVGTFRVRWHGNKVRVDYMIEP